MKVRASAHFLSVAAMFLSFPRWTPYPYSAPNVIQRLSRRVVYVEKAETQTQTLKLNCNDFEIYYSLWHNQVSSEVGDERVEVVDVILFYDHVTSCSEHHFDEELHKKICN